MGDNRNGSSDSRDYRLGTVDTRYVIGKAAFLIFPGPDYSSFIYGEALEFADLLKFLETLQERFRKVPPRATAE